MLRNPAKQEQTCSIVTTDTSIVNFVNCIRKHQWYSSLLYAVALCQYVHLNQTIPRIFLEFLQLTKAANTWHQNCHCYFILARHFSMVKKICYLCLRTKYSQIMSKNTLRMNNKNYTIAIIHLVRTQNFPKN